MFCIHHNLGRWGGYTRSSQMAVASIHTNSWYLLAYLQFVSLSFSRPQESCLLQLICKQSLQPELGRCSLRLLPGNTHKKDQMELSQYWAHCLYILLPTHWFWKSSKDQHADQSIWRKWTHGCQFITECIQVTVIAKVDTLCVPLFLHPESDSNIQCPLAVL